MDPATADRDERVLLLAPSGRDAPLARQVLGEAGLAAEPCADMAALCERLLSGAGTLLVTEEALTPTAFQCLAEAVAQQPPWSDIPLVLLLGPGAITAARLPMLRRIEPLRNVTYLERPVRIMTLISTLRMAQAARRRQYEIRDQLIELAAADRRKDHFLALLGHELRNPLAAIRNSIHLLQRAGARPDERTARLYALMERQMHHVVRLVDDLLDVSRLTLGKITLERRPVDLAELLRRCLQVVSEAIQAQGHALRLTLDGPVWVEGDAMRLEQVFTNLLTNAVKYTPPGGRIEVAAGRAGDQAVVRVRDNGLGIAKEMLPRLFEPFSQASRTLDRAQGGLGIGLSVVRSLVGLHGGSVAAHSEGLGLGSEFIVRLPAREPASPAAAPPAQERRPAAGARRLVVVEDHPDIRESLQELLQELGHEVAAAADGPAGVQRILALRPDAALIDIGLPGLDGYEVARQVRAALGDTILLIAMTGYGQEEDRRRSQAAGFDTHLTKPPELEALLAALTSKQV